MQRVEQRPQVRVDLRHQVAGQEAEPLAGLDRRTREDDPVDLPPVQRRRRERDREEGLAGARRADPERDRVAADRVDVALLVDGLRRDLRRAMAPDDVLQDRGGRLVRVERAGDRLDRAGGELVTLGDELREFPDDGARRPAPTRARRRASARCRAGRPRSPGGRGGTAGCCRRCRRSRPRPRCRARCARGSVSALTCSAPHAPRRTPACRRRGRRPRSITTFITRPMSFGPLEPGLRDRAGDRSPRSCSSVRSGGR